MMADSISKGIEFISDLSMIEASKDFFFDGMLLPTSIYLRVSADNYLLIGKKGDKSQFSTLHSFKNSSTLVFVRKQEYAFLVQFVTGLTQKFVSTPGVPDTVKMKFLTSLTRDAMDSLHTNGFSTVDKVQKVSGLLIQMSQSADSFSSILDVLKDLGDEEAKHSMTTCLISMLLCEEMNINMASTQEKVAVGALLHDIGLKFVPKEILTRPRHLWSVEDMQIYEQHPLKGAELLRDIKDISNDVLLIIVEHHENSAGTGFPKKLRDIKISPLARVVSLADYFSDLLFNTQPNGKSYTPDEAVQYIDEVMGQPFNKQVFLALKNILNKKYLSTKSG